MGRILMIELSDAALDSIGQYAAASGVTTSEIVAAMLGQRFGIPGSEKHEIMAASQTVRERFESHFGEVNLGLTNRSDNEQIDADLGGEYERSLENS